MERGSVIDAQEELARCCKRSNDVDARWYTDAEWEEYNRWMREEEDREAEERAHAKSTGCGI